MIEYKDKQYVCHLDLAMDMIRGKWKAVILCHLNRGTKRFMKLHKLTVGVSQKVLNEKLNELEADGLISKKVYPEVPPKVEYSLTEQGQSIYPALEILEQWGKDLIEK